MAQLVERRKAVIAIEIKARRTRTPIYVVLEKIYHSLNEVALIKYIIRGIVYFTFISFHTDRSNVFEKTILFSD